MYTEGFVKLHRKALETSILSKPKIFAYFVYCIMRAAWKDTKQIRAGVEVTVPRGSFWTTAKQDCKDLKITKHERDTCIRVLQNCKSLTLKTGKDGTMITICNYERYQDAAERQPETNRKPTGNQPETKEEGKEKKEYININKRNSRNEGGRAHSVNQKAKLSQGAQKFMDVLKARAET